MLIEGKKYKTWRVQDKFHNTFGHILWRCECEECGATRNFHSRQLTEDVPSCKCQRKIKITNERDDKLYHIHYSMLKRDDVTVCDEWKDFFKFKQWMLEHGYEIGMRLHRLNLDEGFSPDNVKLYTPIKKV